MQEKTEIEMRERRHDEGGGGGGEGEHGRQRKTNVTIMRYKEASSMFRAKAVPPLQPQGQSSLSGLKLP